MSSERRSAIALAIALLTSMPAAAQDDAPPAAYDGLIDHAVSEFSAGHFPEARALFTQAHELFPNARTLRGLGMASYELRDYPSAVRLLASALTETRRALTESQRTQVNDLLERSRALVGEYIVPAAPEGSRLYVDGAHVTVEGWPSAAGQLLLGVGEHQIAIRDERGRSTTARVDVRAHAEESLDIDLSPLRDAASPPAIPSRPPEPVVQRGTDVAPWILLALGSGVAIVGAIMLGFGVSDLSAVQDSPTGTEWSTLAGAYERAPILTGAGGVSLGVGLGAALIGLIWGIADSGAMTSREPRMTRNRFALEVAW